MLNQMILIGKISNEIVLEKNEYNVSTATLILAIPRRSEDDECDTDFIPITLYGVMAENISNHCKKGDLIAVKGKLACLEDKIRVVADKITFLSTRADTKAE